MIIIQNEGIVRIKCSVGKKKKKKRYPRNGSEIDCLTARRWLRRLRKGAVEENSNGGPSKRTVERQFFSSHDHGRSFITYLSIFAAGTLNILEFSNGLAQL